MVEEKAEGKKPVKLTEEECDKVVGGMIRPFVERMMTEDDAYAKSMAEVEDRRRMLRMRSVT